MHEPCQRKRPYASPCPATTSAPGSFAPRTAKRPLRGTGGAPLGHPALPSGGGTPFCAVAVHVRVGEAPAARGRTGRGPSSAAPRPTFASSGLAKRLRNANLQGAAGGPGADTAIVAARRPIRQARGPSLSRGSAPWGACDRSDSFVARRALNDLARAVQAPAALRGRAKRRRRHKDSPERTPRERARRSAWRRADTTAAHVARSGMPADPQLST